MEFILFVSFNITKTAIIWSIDNSIPHLKVETPLRLLEPSPPSTHSPAPGRDGLRAPVEQGCRYYPLRGALHDRPLLPARRGVSAGEPA